jgi:hypothetical protein
MIEFAKWLLKINFNYTINIIDASDDTLSINN